MVGEKKVSEIFTSQMPESWVAPSYGNNFATIDTLKLSAERIT